MTFVSSREVKNSALMKYKKKFTMTSRQMFVHNNLTLQEKIEAGIIVSRLQCGLMCVFCMRFNCNL